MPFSTVWTLVASLTVAHTTSTHARFTGQARRCSRSRSRNVQVASCVYAIYVALSYLKSLLVRPPDTPTFQLRDVRLCRWDGSRGPSLCISRLNVICTHSVCAYVSATWSKVRCHLADATLRLPAQPCDARWARGRWQAADGKKFSRLTPA